MSPVAPVVVVTGMGAVSALGTGCVAHVDALRAGRDGLRPVERFGLKELGQATAGTWPGWDGRSQPEAGSGVTLEQTAEQFSTVELALLAAREALAAAGLERFSSQRIALLLGTCFGQGFSLFSEVAERVAAALGVRGPVLTISTACSSSTNAVGLGRDLLRDGSADVVLAGGVDIFLREVLAGFSALGVVTREKCAPFSVPTGINLGEGAGVLVLERQLDAHARGAEIVATIDGYGLSADAYHETTPDPNGQGLERAIRSALLDARVDGAAIDHVNAHATGTQTNDATEWRAIERALGPRAVPVPVSGLKSFFGHAQGAAGVLELILGLLALREGLVPPTLRFETPRPGAPPDPVAGPQPRTARVRQALKLSAAFGGANAVLVYGAPAKVPPPAPGVVPAGRAAVVLRGLGVVTPLGLDLASFVEAVGGGRALSGSVHPFELTSVVPTVDPRGTDPSTTFVTAAAALALRDGGLSLRQAAREGSGIFLAATRMPPDSARRCHQSLVRHGPAGMSAAAFARMSVNAPAGACAKHLGLKGPTTTLTIGAGSGLAAVVYAASWLAHRPDATRLLVAAVDEGTQFEGSGCALFSRILPKEVVEGDIEVVGWALAGPDDVAGAARLAVGDRSCPEAVWGEGEEGRLALAPRVADASSLPLGFTDLSRLVAPGEACVSMLALILAAHALRQKRARSILVVAARGRASSVAVLLERRGN